MSTLNENICLKSTGSVHISQRRRHWESGGVSFIAPWQIVLWLEPHSLFILWFDFSFCVVSQLWLVDSGWNSDGLSDVDGDGCSHAHRERWAWSLWGFFLSLKGLKLQTPKDGCWHLVVSCVYGSIKHLNGRSCNTKIVIFSVFTVNEHTQTHWHQHADCGR